MKVWNLLRNPISIFALFATLVLIKSDIFRDVSVSLTKTFSFRERQEAAYELLVTWRPVMPSQIHIQYPYKTTKPTVLRDGLNTHPQGHTYLCWPATKVARNCIILLCLKKHYSQHIWYWDTFINVGCDQKTNENEGWDGSEAQRGMLHSCQAQICQSLRDSFISNREDAGCGINMKLDLMISCLDTT